MKNQKLVINDKFDLFKDDTGELDKFLENLSNRHGGHGDVENIVKEAINKMRVSINKEVIEKGLIDKNGNVLKKEALDNYLNGVTFDVKYLQESLDKMGKLAGEVQPSNVNIPII